MVSVIDAVNVLVELTYRFVVKFELSLVFIVPMLNFPSLSMRLTGDWTLIVVETFFMLMMPEFSSVTLT